MIAKLRVFISAFLIAVLLSSYVYANELPPQHNISVNKVWNITFNKEINPKTLDRNITITDTNGNLVDSSLVLSNDYKTVKVTPKVQYEANKTYIITVNTNIKSLDGSHMSENVTMTFLTQSDEEILAHLPPNGWDPFTATDEELVYYGYPARPNDVEQLNAWKVTVSGGWYDPATGTIPMHTDYAIPCTIVWNNQVYTVDERCGPIYGNKLGKFSEGCYIYEIPGVNSSYGLILGIGDKEGHRYTRVN